MKKEKKIKKQAKKKSPAQQSGSEETQHVLDWKTDHTVSATPEAHPP